MNDDSTTQRPDSNDETKGVAEWLQDTAGKIGQKIGHLFGNITENVKERKRAFPVPDTKSADPPGLSGDSGVEDELPTPTPAPPVGEGKGTSGGRAGGADSEPDTRPNDGSPQL